MGAIHFDVHRPDLLLAGSDLSLVDFLMYDGRVVPARATLEGHHLRCDRVPAESGQLRLPWPRFDGRVEVAQTTSLREQSVPYDLELELARGQLSRLRNQYNSWTSAGLRASDDLQSLISDAHRSFRVAVLRMEAPEVSTAAALASMDLSGRATELLCRHYTEQRLSFRSHKTTHLPVFLGCQLDSVPEDTAAFCSVFNSVKVHTSWSQLEPRDGEYEWVETDKLVDWAMDHRLAVLGGSLVDLSVNRMPDWLKAWTGDLVNLQSFTADYVETVVGRYLGRVRHWEVVTGANSGGVGELNEEQRMNLVARAVEAARQVDEHVHISIRIVQPWGEYLSQTNSRLAPIQFVDTLRRCGVTFDEINLEITATTRPRLTLMRDTLSLSQLLDHWSLLQLPINVMLRVPPRFEDEVPEVPEEAERRQAEWLQAAMSMCLSKERVVGVYYTKWRDRARQTDLTALVRADDSPRPTFGILKSLHDTYWT